MKFVVVQGKELVTGALKKFNLNIEQVAFIEQVSGSEFNVNTSGGVFRTNVAGIKLIFDAAKASVGFLDNSDFLDSAEESVY